MGGWGSGSYLRLSSKRVAENSLPLDIRKIKRESCLTPGRWFSWQWSTGGNNVHSSIGATVHKNHLLLNYTHKNIEAIEQKIDFTYTPCNYGGKRVWFSCPFCSRRCAVIYSYGKYFACRICCNLSYKTSNETPSDRRASKANKLWKHIGAKPGALNYLPIFKPKDMHQTTWDRIRFKIQSLYVMIYKLYLLYHTYPFDLLCTFCLVNRFLSSGSKKHVCLGQLRNPNWNPSTDSISFLPHQHLGFFFIGLLILILHSVLFSLNVIILTLLPGKHDFISSSMPRRVDV